MSPAPLARRLEALPPYLFAEIDRMKTEALARGVDLIDLSIGDPDSPTPEHIVQAMQSAVAEPGLHHYPSSAGMPGFREAVAEWFNARFGVELSASDEVISLIGSKEGVGHLPLAFVDPGDVVLVPSPGYPVYAIGTLFAGGEVHEMPLTEQNGFLPDLDAIAEDVLKRTKLMFLNYPNNPTAAVATEDFFGRVVELAKKHGFIVAHDAAYSEIYFGDKRPISFLEVPGAREVGIELHSLSKTYNMTGWRIGYAVGNRDVVAGLAKIKSNLDSGVFQAVQQAAIAALRTPPALLDDIRQRYRARRDALAEGLTRAGLDVTPPDATFYFWCRVPEGFSSSSSEFTSFVLERAGVLTTPGSGFGAPGEGFVRFALTVSVERTREAAQRIAEALTLKKRA